MIENGMFVVEIGVQIHRETGVSYQYTFRLLAKL